MSTKKEPIYAVVDPPIREALEKEAERKDCSLSTHVRHILSTHVRSAGEGRVAA